METSNKNDINEKMENKKWLTSKTMLSKVLCSLKYFY